MFIYVNYVVENLYKSNRIYIYKREITTNYIIKNFMLTEG